MTQVHWDEGLGGLGGGAGQEGGGGGGVSSVPNRVSQPAGGAEHLRSLARPAPSSPELLLFAFTNKAKKDVHTAPGGPLARSEREKNIWSRNETAGGV